MAVEGLPPDPDDAEWDEWAENQLGDVEFDTALGKQLAEDARRIANGELSKAEFHDRHSENVKAEFDVDERPTKQATLTEAERRGPRIPDDHNQSRRNVLRAMGGLAAAGAASIAGCLDDTTTDVGVADPDVKLGMVIDTTECIACLQCSKACKEENNTDTGVHWPYVFRYEDEMRGESREGYLTRHCQHCAEPSCTYVCPTQARHQRSEDGLVLTDYDTCVGCKYCQVACPYGVNYLGKDEPNDAVGDAFDMDTVDRNDRTTAGSPPKGVMGKCTFCVHRQDSDDEELQGTTACQERCPEDVIRFGDMKDPESDPRQYLRDNDDKNQYKLLDDVGNEPNITYIGQQPSKDAEPIQGPVAYEDHRMKDGAYEYPDRPRPDELAGDDDVEDDGDGDDDGEDDSDGGDEQDQVSVGAQGGTNGDAQSGVVIGGDVDE